MSAAARADSACLQRSRWTDGRGTSPRCALRDGCWGGESVGRGHGGTGGGGGGGGVGGAGAGHSIAPCTSCGQDGLGLVLHTLSSVCSRRRARCGERRGSRSEWAVNEQARQIRPFDSKENEQARRGVAREEGGGAKETLRIPADLTLHRLLCHALTVARRCCARVARRNRRRLLQWDASPRAAQTRGTQTTGVPHHVQQRSGQSVRPE